jgi:SAM-dependent methyltransferase
MLEQTRRRSFGDRQIAYRVADAIDLPFRDDSFDLVVCQFGLMFVTDRQKALAEANRVLKPGGHHLLNVWDGMEHNPIGRLAQDQLTAAFPGDTPGFFRIPFGMSDRGQLRDLILASGLRDAILETVAIEGTSPSALDAATGMVTGTPTISALRQRGIEDPGPLISRLAAELERVGGRAPLRIPLQAIVVSTLSG